ncbi:HAD family hydrolase [Rhizobium sp. RM]|uniref:HAD family hydrolase n=1 Tax=Rhizobium sp. RM TaxID=2748079 RepID=UPI00110E8F5A|nr:HAD family hydrolase [Rhizobium sp. RM]NWJ23654.1 HAD family hydrolase [Rhizobium sp. RM]TMV19484.1 HAD family hydrolase [Rhizobium sp. Td3]
MHNKVTKAEAALTREHSAFLFDMDGTLVNSIAVVERVWREWAVANGIEPNAFLNRIHGMRASEVVRREAVPGLDVDEQAAILLQKEMDDVDGIVQIPGAAEFLKKLPVGTWAIVTSAARALAERRLAAAGLTPPEVMICAEDVVDGKPDPEGYKKAAAMLGILPENCVVFEDAPAGIQAGERMGATVVVINTTHSHPIDAPHLSIGDYAELGLIVSEDGKLKLTSATT